MSPKSLKTQQDPLLQIVDRLGPDLSTQTLLFHQSVAAKLGLNATDTKCIGLITRSPSQTITAGELAQALGLTTGAITGVIDRLEKAGLAERIKDPLDRRKVVLRLKEQASTRLAPYYARLRKSVLELVSSYSKTDQKLLADFLEKIARILENEANKVQSDRR